MIGLPRPPYDWSRPDPLVCRGVAPVIATLVGLHVELEVVGADRVPDDGPVILAANHPSYLDSLVLGVMVYRLGRLPRFLALDTLFDHRLAGPVLRSIRAIPVHRGAGVEPTVEPATDALVAGQLLLVYPEGQLAPPGVDPPARPGAGLLALRSGAPVLPVASAGLEPPEDGWWVPPLRRRAGVVIGPPVDLSQWAGRDDRDAQLAASAAMLADIRALVPAARAVCERR